MQQKYGAPIPDAQVEPLVDYLTRNYGLVTTNVSGAQGSGPGVTAQEQTRPSVASDAGHAASEGSQIALKYGCLTCHNPTTKVIGPAYREIAAKYKSDPEAFSKIDQQIHQGGSGKWGPIITPPFPQISGGETKILADWILNLR